MSSGALEAIERVLNRGGEPAHVLRQVVSILHERGGCTWAAFAGTDSEAGRRPPDEPERHDVLFGGRKVGELQAVGGDHALLERVALLVSPYCRR